MKHYYNLLADAFHKSEFDVPIIDLLDPVAELFTKTDKNNYYKHLYDKEDIYRMLIRVPLNKFNDLIEIWNQNNDILIQDAIEKLNIPKD